MIVIGSIILISDIKYKYLGIVVIVLFVILIFIHINSIFEMIKSLKNGEKFDKSFGLLMILIGILFIIINIYELR